jgi:hypothetical protein
MGEGMSSYLVYRVETKTNASYFKKKEFFVIRRFSDFLGLHQKLTEKYLQNGRIIPPAPDKNVVGTTKIKMAKDGGETPVHDEVKQYSTFLTKPPKNPLKRFCKGFFVGSFQNP